jgi:PST family polysaccharide transporter
VPIVQVLAVAGALQSIYQCSTSPLVLGTGHDKLNLRYAWLSTAVATVGIVAGLPFGPFGVALGYSVATALLVPVEWLIRRHLVEVSLREQLSSLLPAAHVAAWMAATYLTVAVLVTDRDAVVLGLGSVAAVGVGGLALRIGHPRLLADLVIDAKRLAGRDGSADVTGEPR